MASMPSPLERYRLAVAGPTQRMFGEPYLGVHRRHFQRCLLRAVDQTALHLNHRLGSLIRLANGKALLEFANDAQWGWT